MTQLRSDCGDGSIMSYCFGVTVKVLIIYLRVLFFAWISALMPPNQVYHSFSHKKSINPCCNSVCRTENVVGYIPRRWQFNGSSGNLTPWGRNQRMFYAVKSSRRSFSEYLWKKSWRMVPMLRNVVITKKCWFRENCLAKGIIEISFSWKWKKISNEE